MSTTPKTSCIPLRSPTPPLDSSSDELNELSLDQELAQMERPHFLDYIHPYSIESTNDQPPPIPPRHPLTNSLPLPLNRNRSSIPVKMIRSADNVPMYDANVPSASPSQSGGSAKKHFLDENPIRPDYEYDRPPQPTSTDRLYERKEHHHQQQQRDNVNAIKMQFDGRRHTVDRQKQKKCKEPSYTLSRFLETDDAINQFNDNGVQLGDVNLSTNSLTDRSGTQNSNVDYVYSLLSMIGCNNPVEMSKKFLELSKSPNTCATLRHSQCIPLLVQMIHCSDDELTRRQAREALRNVVNYLPDDKVGRREAKVLRCIEQIMDYCDLMKKSKENENSTKVVEGENHSLSAMGLLMKISFDEEFRHSMCTLGALQTIANLVYCDHAVHGTNPKDPNCISLRRYAGVALTNMTFGDGNNKANLCANRDFMKALVAQINTDADDLLQVTANCLRNLSWRADNNMKTVLNEIGTVTALTLAAMKKKNENTLRAILSALWNLSAHSQNKAEFCNVDGALAFLVKMLTYESQTSPRNVSIIENAGGILHNVSSQIAVNEDYRKILRQGNCLGILLEQLKSESLTIVSNACGTLWNLSARCPEDQTFLWDNGAVPMLRSLIHSKHKMISHGSKVALKNLVNFRPGGMNRSGLDPVAKMMGLTELPTLSARKQRALEDELAENLSETCENFEVTKTPPLHHKAAKSLMVLERDQQYIERSFGNLSLQCNLNETSANSKSNSKDFWETKQFPSNDFNINQAPVQHPTGTIPKRSIQAEANAPTVVRNDSDQITNFSLVYSENHPENRDVKEKKNRSFSNAEEDTVKCYVNEDTPMMSTATSISDLPKHHISHNNMHRHLKNGRTTTENSGINTPEKPINYCEEGTPAYFSRRDSFSSLHEEAEFIQDDIDSEHKSNQINILPAHSNNAPNDQIRSVDRGRQDYENNDSNNCTVPTTPGECASKTVTFNEFNLETPMMFSRHSSLGSLASHEPPLNDDIGSVVSETSRMPSGIISPSEIPDSPSQTMPQSPRQKHSRENAANQRRLPFDDEVRTFGVENTPALISCATSLSNLSLDDEPKIANDLLIKEMRLMHHLSDEQDDEPNPIASTSADQNDVDSNLISNAIAENCDAGEALSDSDESINDDDSLLKNCISMGIQAKIIEPDIKSPPALPEPNDILPDDSSSEDDDLGGSAADLLEQCIRSGITKKAIKPETSGIPSGSKLNRGIRLPPQQMINKENPIGMLRKGGNSFIETNYDEPNRFHIEDSPCNFSIASGLSDLTVGSEMLKVNRFIPSIQSDINEETDGNLNENCSLSPISVNSEENRHLLNQAVAAGKARILSRERASNATSSQSSSAATVQHVSTVKQPDSDTESDDSNSSISSIDSNDSNAMNLLQECINMGMSKVAVSQTKTSSKLPSTKLGAAASVNHSKKSHLPTLKASAQPTSNHRSRSTKREDDKQCLYDCINAGIEMNVRSKSTVIEKSLPNLPIKHRHESSSSQLKCLPSKNVQTTSATVQILHTAGATDVVTDTRRGTIACAPAQHQPVVNSASSMISKNERDQNIIHITDDTFEITATPTTTQMAAIETGYNNLELNTSTMSTKSHNSFNMGELSKELSLLERSNEYPAQLGQNESIYDSQHSSSVDMEVSNECLFENLSPPKMDKHKDPNLMLQSVERLTHELVSTAEYLRTANSLDDDITITESKNTLSESNNTWNEDTNPNAIPFPKMSKKAPVIASMDDDTTISELNGSRYEMANSEFIEDSAPNNNRIMIDSNGLRFEIGGKVNMNSGTFNCNGFDSNSTTSTMTNSTIIAIEANKIRSQLMKENKTDSMISLDKIRPPSVMDKMNNSSCCDSLTGGASSLNRSPARFLTQGFMARRALNNNGNNSNLGSTDSINSSLNLDKVKPPSIMDDLLDSMISVDSIASELVEQPPLQQQQQHEEQSNYETAFSECDDMTQTLKNCADLPFDDGNSSTPCGSDFSSVESTPKKGRRSLTPRRKRQLTKERYQTYTISTNNAEAQQQSENGVDEAIREKHGIFEMDLSNHTLLINGNDSDAISLVSSDGEMSSIRAFTKNLPFLNDISIHNDVSVHKDFSINTNTYTKLPRGSIQNCLQSPMPSGDFYESLPMDKPSSNTSSKTSSPNRNITKSPRVIKPTVSTMAATEKIDSSNQPDEPKVIRGRKKPAYISPYSMAKLNKSTPQPKEINKPKLPNKVVSPKVEPTKTPPISSKTVESKAKSFIQRSAESLKKMRPTFTSKLSKQSPTKKGEKQLLDRQKSSDSTKSSETLVRQGTFIKDEPSSEGEIPVIVSEPTSPKKTKTLVSRIPFNRATSLQASGVTKSNTNIEIPLQKNASSTFIRRTIKSASSTSQISSSSSRGSLSPRQSLDSPSTSKSIFNRWTNTPNKKISPLPTTATKLSSTKTTSRESIGSSVGAATKSTGKIITKTSPASKASRIITPRTISTNGRTMKV
ncbi:uncharacterized protein LOC116343560 [Contarinia nasturtii]|uniref:uncharacterized protein LOC116343560 n=1 Tax=Contarinia nasturtii TaxID=265458 RepID=UPI0012D4A207|nr:uncharacterized protein LOC116343560 [Contarinia nasturtii]XP_031627551.1 uncharacterized protein LOC116343560 [Contarinia nasturtii]